LDDAFVVESQMVSMSRHSKTRQQPAPGPCWGRTECTRVMCCVLALHEACSNTASLTGCMRTATKLQDPAC
jgi:hypothetical protein